MDPNETLRMLALAVLAEDRYGANEHYVALRSWLERGGFEPAWTHMSRVQFFRYNTQTGQIGG